MAEVNVVKLCTAERKTDNQAHFLLAYSCTTTIKYENSGCTQQLSYNFFFQEAREMNERKKKKDLAVMHPTPKMEQRIKNKPLNTNSIGDLIIHYKHCFFY